MVTLIFITCLIILVFNIFLMFIKKKTNKKEIKGTKDILNKIKSNYILTNIFGYINNETKLKLFVHSKLYQKKFNLQLNDYLQNYVLTYGIDFEKYIGNYKKIWDNYYYLKEDELLKDFKTFEKYIIDYFKIYKNKFLKKYSEDNIVISLISPYFPIFSKIGIFNQIFTIEIPRINKDNNESIINVFKNINKTENKISSILIRSVNSEDIDKIKKLNINFNYIKRLSIYEREYSYCVDDIFDNFFKYFKNNLTYLSIVLYEKLNPKYIKQINNLKCLETLKIEAYKSAQDQKFIIKS